MRAGRAPNLPRSGYSSGPATGTRYSDTSKGNLPRTGYSSGPTPGARYRPPDSPGDGGHGGGGHGGGGHGGGYHHGYYYGGYGHGYYGRYWYPPYYFGRYYRPYYHVGLGYGYYPYYYYDSPHYRRTRVVHVEPQGALDLNVRPKDTQVFLNGYYIGTASDFDGWPRYLWLDEDAHELIFFKEGYETVVRDFAIQADAVINVKFRMQPGPSTPPEELTRYKEEDRYDRRYSSRNDRDYQERDRREYREREYRERSPTLPEKGLPESSEAEQENVDLRTEAGRLKVTVTPAEASIYIDGRFVGIGGELSNLEFGLLMDPGEHRIEIFHPDYETQVKSFDVEAGQDTKVEISLSKSD